MTFLLSKYDPWLVALSIVIASIASYVALDLAKRVRTPDRALAVGWWAGGSVAMGSGIWSMHFVGMLAFSLPVQLGYTTWLTIASWAAGVAVSGVALAVAGYGQLTLARLTLGAVAMGAGICAMHYLGMAALDMAPGIVWDAWLVAASAAIAVVASGAALSIFFWLRRFNVRRGMPYQAGAAVVMGFAICGMHYTGMAAAAFPTGSVCLSAGAIVGERIGALVILASVLMLGMTWLTSILDARMQDRAARLASALQVANTQLRSANDELRLRTLQDPLTALANRELFEDRLKHAIARCERSSDGVAERHRTKLAVLFVDLDGFKPVNDSFGHGTGDLLLKEVARRLAHAARDSDTVARVGGDEFLVLMEDVATIADCASLAQRIVGDIARPLEIGKRRVEISASVGIAIFPDHGRGEKLVAHADSAMYAAKRAGGNSMSVFEAHMDSDALYTLSLQSDLRHAVERGELQLYYQPKIDGHEGRIHGVEALVRWNHPQRGLLSPGVFIPLAERFGLIGAIGNWVIEEACRQMRDWAEVGVRMRVAINLSAYQLREPDLVERIERALQRERVEPSCLLCEITESVAMEDIQATQTAFEGLARIGVFLSIDDFGTGYSSLSYLRQLPARQLKIDRSFVQDLQSSSDARAVVDAVVRLAHALGLRVVAEGVETAGQRDALVRMGCDEMQGFLFARPMPAAELLDWALGRRAESMADFAPSVVAQLDSDRGM
ncbi:EAL domain-containing protein [Aquincola sp. S2]|uniref:EAL domain-containing protein n=1 Tax=Pseudaquabacterium terrae TaxID=2732868 RepID=A0ABX2ETL3_9BURK|nr:EAL domain-containing protein [Aquabacterium terrae]NRF72049.1 EAL domain-containing protein [Aquabacterium terrae]